jgi:hypothetical protein
MEKDIFDEAKRVVETASERGITLKLLGGLATRVHCTVLEFCRREYSDIDVMGLSREKKEIDELFSALGYTPDTRFNTLHGHKRLKFEEDQYNRHVDVFLDRFDMDHDWDLSERFDREQYTLPLSDLLLMKLQICQITKKDIRDIITMLKDSTIGDEDRSNTINKINYIAERCAKDWGMYESVLENVRTVSSFLDQYGLTAEEKMIVEKRLMDLSERLTAHPKTAKWKLRSAVGTHMKWCKEVEE